MGHETDLEARCRLAYECGSLMSQLESAKEYIAFLENKRLPRCYQYTSTRLDGIGIELASDRGELAGVYITGTCLEPSYFSEDLQEQWQSLVTADLAERNREAA